VEGEELTEWNPASQAELQRLWGFAFPGAPWQGLQAERWTDMGWQRDDPSSDFRGAGLIALQNLLYLAQARPCCLVSRHGTWSHACMHASFWARCAQPASHARCQPALAPQP
jgi:hypothetical protein